MTKVMISFGNSLPYDRLKSPLQFEGAFTSLQKTHEMARIGILIGLSMYMYCACIQNSYAQTGPYQKQLITDQGGDRATAYTMSNKILMLEDGILCTWIDRNRQNRWSFIDHEGNQAREGKIGGIMPDNHCGAALAQSPGGTIHAVIGGHHSNLYHYQMDDIRTSDWSLVDSIVARATYPSLVSSQNGKLYLSFRHKKEKFWSLDLVEFENNQWSGPRTIVEAAKPGYVYWTNSLSIGSDDRVHLLFANVQPGPPGFEKGSLYHGASHLFSGDGGKTWVDYAKGKVKTPVRANDLGLIEGEYKADRLASPGFLEQYAEGGPTSKEYMQIQLSNLVIDQSNVPHFLYHNGFKGTVALRSYLDGQWVETDLSPALHIDESRYRVHMQSSLSSYKGDLYAGIMLVPTKENVWGADGTITVVLKINVSESNVEKLFQTPGNLSTAQWLPSFAHSHHWKKEVAPVMLHTEGINAGGFQNNYNEIATKVWLVKFLEK